MLVKPYEELDAKTQGDVRSEIWRELLNVIERRPDMETVFWRAIGVVQDLLGAVVEDTTDFPEEL